MTINLMINIQADSAQEAQQAIEMYQALKQKTDGEIKTSKNSNNSSMICKLCGAEMVLRTNGKGEKFLGCKSYPNCRQTMPYNDKNKTEKIPDEVDEVPVINF